MVGALFVGPESGYARIREALKQQFPGLPCMAQLSQPESALQAFRLLQRNLRPSPDKPVIRFLTDDVANAEEARRRMGALVQVSLLAPTAGEAAGNRAGPLVPLPLEAFLESLKRP
jgi:hypothetical protein